jgi:hypothetical protein
MDRKLNWQIKAVTGLPDESWLAIMNGNEEIALLKDRNRAEQIVDAANNHYLHLQMLGEMEKENARLTSRVAWLEAAVKRYFNADPVNDVADWQDASDELIGLANVTEFALPIRNKPECDYCGAPECPHCAFIDFGIKPLEVKADGK